MRIGIVANAPMDLIVSVEDDLLVEFGLRRERCTKVSWATAHTLVERLDGLDGVSVLSPGGCGANIAVWLKMLGAAPTIVAPFATDEFGRTARASILEQQIRCLGYDYADVQARTFTMITADRERTFASVHGVVPTAILADILPLLAEEPYLLIDGYVLEHDGAADVLMAYLDHRKPAGQKIVFCPNDTSVILGHERVVGRLVELADCLIMNENEAEALFPNESDEVIIEQLCRRGKHGAITYDLKGATVFGPDGAHRVSPAEPPHDHVNTVGAGDAFAAGYLAGRFRNLGSRWCGELGRYCAAEILTKHSARPDLFQALAALSKLEQTMATA